MTLADYEWPMDADEAAKYEMRGAVFLQSANRRWMNPYPVAYRDAAQKLFDAARAGRAGTLTSMMAPILFLARHSLELLLKTLIYEAVDLVSLQSELEAYETTANSYGAFPEKFIDSIAIHELGPLLTKVEAALKHVRLEDDLKSLRAAVDAFRAVEGEEFMFFRYETNRKRQDLLEKSREIPVAAIMDAFFAALDAYWEKGDIESNPTTVHGYLAQEIHANVQRLTNIRYARGEL